MTVVYPLAAQSDYTELKYSLRSIDKYLPQPFEVIIVGSQVPDWINNVTVILLPDIANKKLLSVRRKILAALEYVKDEIIFMNDDFFLLSETSIPYYYNGDLIGCINSGSKQLQVRLKELKLPTKHFDLHYPIIFGQDFKQIIENFPSDCLIRSAYCNYLRIEGVQMADRKFLKAVAPDVLRQSVEKKIPISTGEGSLQSVLPVLHELFPNKSIFEL